ncbi:hypothetical protein F5144DRAFT_219916 [Chaetomium tenue]|uniref:Uncharacterized protein n=1 Tax=Chaetomium tenue TaxID=1854479 RepID=A0ACB7P9F9_9PEZI|nr:hypothetical protein F5144DRAFT_219916 [Chaetomium globosum]
MGGSDKLMISPCWYNTGVPGCRILESVATYTKAYGFLALDATGNLNNIKTTWTDRVIEKPALNISAFYIPSDAYYGNNWVDPRTNQTPYATYVNQVFMTPTGNRTYNFSSIQERGSCQPFDNNTYQWGFSFVQLFIVMSLLFLWFVAVYTMWLRGYLELKRRQGDEAPTRYQAVLDLAEALNHELDGVDEAPKVPTNRELERCISKQLNGGRVVVQTRPPLGKGYSFWKGAWSWIKREKWCFALAVLVSLVPAVAPWVLPLAFFVPFSLSMILALIIGRSRESRELIGILGLILSLILMASVGPVLPARVWGGS